MTSDKPFSELVPADFPRPCGGSVSGVQNKLIARKIEGRFIVDGMTDEELRERYFACQELAAKLVAHANSKRGQYAELSLKEFLRRYRAGVVKRGWDLAAEELDWVMRRVAVATGGEPDDAPGQPTWDASWFAISQVPTEAPVETLVDRVRAKLLQGTL